MPPTTTMMMLIPLTLGYEDDVIDLTCCLHRRRCPCRAGVVAVFVVVASFGLYCRVNRTDTVEEAKSDRSESTIERGTNQMYENRMGDAKQSSRLR